MSEGLRLSVGGTEEGGEQIEPVLYQTSLWLWLGFKDEVFPPTGQHWHGIKPNSGTVIKVDVSVGNFLPSLNMFKFRKD